VARRALVPTAQQRELVKSLAGYGLKQEDIAVMLELRSPKTLRKHFRKELATGAIVANATVAQSLYTRAVAGDSRAMTFWLQHRAGWGARGVPAAPAGEPARPSIAGLRTMWVEGECRCGHPYSVHDQSHPEGHQTPCQYPGCDCRTFTEKENEGIAP